MLRPTLYYDDFPIVFRSWTWQRTWDELWVPANEHAMPLGRLTTWLLVQMAGTPTQLPWVCVPQGPFAVVLGMVILRWFVQRELDSPFLGLLAMIVFGVTTIYQQATLWFSASFSLLAVDSLLLGLLAAQHWRQRGSRVAAVLCCVACLLAPTWFALGVLAGPLCALYLIFPETDPKRLQSWLRPLARAVLPCLGGLLFLAISLPRTAHQIMHLEHYDQSDALRSFHPLTGLWYTMRSIVENLILGQIGLASLDVSILVVLAVWPFLLWGLWGLWHRAPAGRRLTLLGIGMILSGYWLVYSARATWGYDGVMNRPNWSRYHLLPQLGLALLLVAGWTVRLRSESGVTRQRRGALLCMIVVLSFLHLPRIILTFWGEEHGEQQALLRQVEAMDAQCQAHRIGATVAQAALPPLKVVGADERDNGWELLRGSADPDPSLTVEDARRLLSRLP